VDATGSRAHNYGEARFGEPEIVREELSARSPRRLRAKEALGPGKVRRVSRQIQEAAACRIKASRKGRQGRDTLPWEKSLKESSHYSSPQAHLNNEPLKPRKVKKNYLFGCELAKLGMWALAASLVWGGQRCFVSTITSILILGNASGVCGGWIGICAES